MSILEKIVAAALVLGLTAATAETCIHAGQAAVNTCRRTLTRAHQIDVYEGGAPAIRDELPMLE